ncbi:MAG: hypothetical protein JXR50_06835 [Prolixibacteraceae bacterium]|nr:hypothetical protein [Prolixibacteraceae bacterium]MBN2649440.1 hypothetical protein [Prolixibacteraceae bacterium]
MLCLFFSAIVYAQNNTEGFFVTGRVKVDQGVVEGTTIQIVRDGLKWKEISLNRTGSFRVSVGLGHVYEFVCSKPGYYPKTIELDTNLPSGLCDDDCSFPPYQMAILIYQKVPGVETMDNKTARVSYNPKIDNFDAEILRGEIDNTINIDEIVSDTRDKSRKYEQQSMQESRRQYNALISEADRLFNQAGFDLALKKYRDALLLFPSETYPRQQIQKTYELQVANDLYQMFGRPNNENFPQYLNYADKMVSDREYTIAKVAYEKALLVKPNDEMLKSKFEKAKGELDNMKRLALDELMQKERVYEARTEKYNQLVVEGDRLLKNEDYAGAKRNYALAASQIDENSYALLMIDQIDQVLNKDDLIERLAKEREAEEQARLRDARNRAYDDAVEEADRLFAQRLYRDAIEYYELALTVKNYEQYPKNQVRIIRDILADLQLRGEEYNRLLREADQLMTQRKFADARPLYQSAHELIPDEQYALDKIAEIDRLLQMPDDYAMRREKYDEFIKIADDFYDAKEYTSAIYNYNEAHKIFTDEAYPQNQIAKIRGILSREESTQLEQEQLQNEYDRVIARADNAFNQESYQSARTLYLEALNLIPGQEYPQNQLRRINQLLRELAEEQKNRSILEQIDFSNLDVVSENIRKAAYDEAMKLGNDFMENSEWALARFYFRRALALIPGDSEAEKKIAEVEQKILGDNANETRFKEMVQRADEAYNTGDFGVARFYYSKAHDLSPNDEYVIERLQVSEQLASSTAKRVANREYDEAMSKANEALNVKNYSVARFFYRKALSLKPNDTEATEKIKELEKLMAQ